MASSASPEIAVIGAGPAGLCAAEVLATAGRSVVVLDRMPSVGRKFLMAGRGGLNLTHSEPLEAFVPRYGTRAEILRPMLEAFPPAALREWAAGLGQATFVGPSGRVFPTALKASPLLRAWLARLGDLGVEIRTRTTWTGWTGDGDLAFDTPEAPLRLRPRATVLALGGASWPKLGSNGAWAPSLAKRGVALAPFRPANMGFDVAWSPLFRDRFAGQPLKAVALSFGGRTVKGEAMVASYGLEGGAVYALAAPIRDAIAAVGRVTVEIDLRPDQSLDQLVQRLVRAPPGQSFANTLRKGLNLAPVAANLLREAGPLPTDPQGLARRIKAVPLAFTGYRGLERAISSAGGVTFEAVDARLMLRQAPGTFVAGEMLDWEAPTGGYLLQASFATGAAAARSVLAHLQEP